MVGWIETLLQNFKGCINHAGNISDFFGIDRGCRQGDPCASLLFICAIEILCIKLRASKKVKGFKIGSLSFLLSLYADDCSIFLEYNENNLRNVLDILKTFHHLSGLEIHLKKTQCIIFGKKDQHTPTLCHDLDLDWNQKFKLLGVTFNADTLDYSENFNIKIEEMKSITLSWKYRFLSPLGRLCIAKTLLLSKVNHLAFVIPVLSKAMTKKIEDLIYSYIWGGADKVARVDAKLCWEKGGMNMPDVANSWASFKLSWFRRLMSSQGTWTKSILTLIDEARGAAGGNFWTILELEAKQIAKKVSNPFWKECLIVLESFRRDFLIKFPEEIIYSQIWGSDIIKRGNRRLFRLEFPSICIHINTIADFLRPTVDGNCRLLEWNEMLLLSRDAIFEEFLSLKLAIRHTLEFNNLTLDQLIYATPNRPTLISLLSLSTKGCGKWQRLRSLHGTSKGVAKREDLWNTALGRNQGIAFWDKCYANTKNICFNNRIKWLQFQIVRGTLKTNRIVSKFANNVSNQCSFCQNDTETITHLFWNCAHVQLFFQELRGQREHTNFNGLLNDDLKSFIFNTKGNILNIKNLTEDY